MNHQNQKARIITIGIFEPLTKENKSDFILKALPALGENKIQVLCLEKGDEEYLKEYKKIAEKYETITLVDNVDKIFKKSDAVLLTDNGNKKLLDEIKTKKIIPILEKTEGYETFNAQTETGNAFTFESGNFWQFLFAIHRAAMNYEFSYDWSTIKRNINKRLIN